MDLRQLRCLIAVSETLHFGKAAQNMKMLPASFGRQIKLLEDHLGIRLLDRTTRHVDLTEAGNELVEAARSIVEQADRLEQSFRERRRDRVTKLRIGAIDSAAAGLMPQLVSLLAEAHPDMVVEILEQKTFRLLPRLLSGRLDLAIIRPPEAQDSRLSFRQLFFETAMVAVPHGHRLAEYKAVSVEDMVNEPLIVPDRRSRPHSHDLTMKLFLEAGHTARVAQIAEEKQTIVGLVGSGMGLAIVPKWASRFAVEGVAFVPLELSSGPVRDKLALSAAWVGETRHPARDAFLTILEDNLSQLAASA